MKKYLLVSINGKVDCFSYDSYYAFALVVEENTIPTLMLFTVILRFFERVNANFINDEKLDADY